MTFPFDEHAYLSMLNEISVPMHVIDTSGVLIFANHAWEKMVNVSLADAQGRFINEVIKPRNTGFYFAFEKSDAENRLQVTHFSEKNYDSIALHALKLKKTISMFAYSRQNKRVMLTSTPIWMGDAIAYVLTVFQNLTDFSELYGQLESAIETNKLIVDELEFYRSMNLAHTQDIVGESPAIQSLLRNVRQIAATDATVLITGESGVGKEVLTNEIFRLSKRRNGPFIRVNCASIPENLLESELFGYEKGAFTGAAKRKLGMFELANNGTLLLDEIGELPKTLQPKLLRALQEREVMRVGGTAPVPVDVRLIAATNRDLESMVRDGEFRQDLYYRLNLIPLYIPPLRERAEDIPLLAQHFLDKFNSKYGKNRRISGDAIQVMKTYPWPGNIRELENLLERLVIISDEPCITAGQVSKILGAVEPALTAGLEEGGLSLKELVAQYEKELLQEAFTRYGTTYRVAEALRSSQPTIARKAKQYGLKW